MTYLLDANACIAILNDRTSAVARQAVKVARHEIALSHIVKAELYYGAFKSSRRGEQPEAASEVLPAVLDVVVRQ